MEAFERAKRLPALAGFRGAWRSERRSLDENPGDVEIEVVDVSAQLMQKDDKLEEHSLDRREESNILSIDESQLNADDESDEDNISLKASVGGNRGASCLDKRQEAARVHASEMMREAASDANGHSKPYNRGRSPQRGTKLPGRVPPQSIDCQAKKPGLKSKTPPMIDIPLLKTSPDLPLSPTQSLPVVKNGVYRTHNGFTNHRLHGLVSPTKEHVVDIPASFSSNQKCESGRPNVSNGYMSESGQARPPPIKASSKKPPRCPSSHSGVNGESGHHMQHGRRRRESGEADKSKAKRGATAGAARWKMKLVTAILLACFGVLLYFQVFYMRPQQLQAIMRNGAQKNVLGAGLVSSGRAAHQEGPYENLTQGDEKNATEAEALARRKLLWHDSTGGRQPREGTSISWITLLFGDTAKREANAGGGVIGKGQKDERGRKNLAASEGQRHERDRGVNEEKQSTTSELLALKVDR